jgi:hypothetical protein
VLVAAALLRGIERALRGGTDWAIK